jgi:CheY-like chemotaxis protein
VGSTFWFTARLRRGLGAAPAVADATPALAPVVTVAATENTDAEALLLQRHGKARILVADDNELNRDLVLSLLLEVGLSADAAADGREALHKAQAGTYDLILMDIQMPVMDGMAATRAIRALPGRARVPILAMTANAFEEERTLWLAAGMNDFIIKPVKISTFHSLLLKWLT